MWVQADYRQSQAEDMCLHFTISNHKNFIDILWSRTGKISFKVFEPGVCQLDITLGTTFLLKREETSHLLYHDYTFSSRVDMILLDL